MTVKDFTEILPNVANRWSGRRIRTVAALTPDASKRRYYRLFFEGLEQTAVAMCFDSVSSPEAGGVESIDADRAAVELTHFFLTHDVRVPLLYVDARDVGVLLIEDFGDAPLFSVFETASQDTNITVLYQESINQIMRIQRIPKHTGFFPFERAFTAVQYRLELQEFRDYFLCGKSSERSQLEVFDQLTAVLGQELEQLPRVLAHRDFHSWNLMLLPENRIGVIDFQDALLAPCSYDLVALLNDRDTDRALGPTRYKALLNYFCDALGPNEGFRESYSRVLLQRDLKVVGRFSKIAKERGLTGYLRWVPGTLARIGATLLRIAEEKRGAEYANALSMLRDISEDLERGAAGGIRF